MVNYGNGKIYKIVSNQTDKVYIGSTTKKYLSQRMDDHRRNFRDWKNKKFPYLTSFDILQFDDANIVLIEGFDCKSKDELRSREQHYIEQFKDVCVNSHYAIGVNIQKIRQKDRERYYRDKPKRIALVKKRYEQKKDEINAKRNAKTKCSCGSVISRSRLAKHSKTNKHKQWIQQELEWLSEQKRQLEEDSKLLEQDKHLFD